MKLRTWVLTTVLTALSVVLASVTIPGVLGTPALDSLPGFVASFVLGVGPGALVGALGHMFTAGLHGLPLTLPVHLMIAAEMAAVMATGALARRRFGWVVGSIWCIFANGVVAPALFLPWPGFGMAFVVAVMPQLLIASVINVVIGAAVSKAILASGAAARFIAEKG